MQNASDLPEASYNPHPVDEMEPNDDPAQFLAGCLKDAACRWRGDLPRTTAELRAVFFLLIDAAIREAGENLQSPASDASMDAVTEMLHRLAESSNARLMAHCYLLVINRSPYSETDIAKKLGVTKANVSDFKTHLQDKLKLTPRVGRSEESRQKFREICLKRGKRNPPKETWKAASLFLNPAPLQNA